MRDLVSQAVRTFLSEESGLAPLLPEGTGLESLLRQAARQLGKPVDELVEDLGAWLVRQEEIRRLLRFCGRDFPDFVLGLDQLPDRIRLVTDDLDVPAISLSRGDHGQIRLTLSDAAPGWAALLSGVLRAMADDYGALCVITRSAGGICIDVSDSAFAAARSFRLSPRAAAR